MACDSNENPTAIPLVNVQYVDRNIHPALGNADRLVIRPIQSSKQPNKKYKKSGYKTINSPGRDKASSKDFHRCVRLKFDRSFAFRKYTSVAI